MNIKLPAGKNIPKKNIIDYHKHVQKILNQKIALERSNVNNKMAINEINRIRDYKLN